MLLIISYNSSGMYVLFISWYIATQLNIRVQYIKVA